MRAGVSVTREKLDRMRAPSTDPYGVFASKEAEAEEGTTTAKA
jgi:hypothetical protein